MELCIIHCPIFSAQVSETEYKIEGARAIVKIRCTQSAVSSKSKPLYWRTGELLERWERSTDLQEAYPFSSRLLFLPSYPDISR
jgi:hypothetical protein